MHSDVISKAVVKKGEARLIFLSCFLSLLTFTAFAQTISLSIKGEPIEKVFRSIEAQTSFRFIYSKETIKSAKPVTLQADHIPVKEALVRVFRDQPLSYSVEDQYIMVRLREEKRVEEDFVIRGKVTDETGNPLPGVNVVVRATGKGTTTDENGEFIMNLGEESEVLVFSFIGRETEVISVKRSETPTVILKTVSKTLDETIIQAYGTTTRRLNTGNIAKVTGEDISKQPVSNPLAALEGRVPGLIITQSNGYGSGAVDIQLRGQNSILQGSQPFVLVDGVPLAAGNNAINQLLNAGGGFSPFYTLNPSDIESIEVLKDADATAIYGSRGANGVILITTKKGVSGKTRVGVDTYTGFSRVTRTMDMLDTRQYVGMRKEAFANDGIAPSISNAADLLLWDTTRYTDIKRLFLGGTAREYNTNVLVSGGTAPDQFLISATFRKAGTVLPGNLADYKAAFHSSMNHASANAKFNTGLTVDYSYVQTNLPAIDPASFINRPPNILLYKENGELNWEENGVSFFSSTGESGFSNPLASLKTVYKGNYYGLNGALNLSYKLLPSLRLKSNFGFNSITSDEFSSQPTASLDPYDNNQKPGSFFGNGSNRTWIIEPQLEFIKRAGKNTFTVLGGSTWQKKRGDGTSITATNYQSDLFLGSINGAGSVTTSKAFDEYRYTALFLRLNYNRSDKYILNLTGRRDGSSRFGPGRQFNNFMAVGGAWIFTAERFISKALPFLSYGKIRGSYGTTGNDAIGDYQYLDTWTVSPSTYQGITVLNPTALFNPDLAWEVNKKFEAAVDLGVLHQRALVSGAFFLNRSSNQLVLYNLPVQTGFPGINKNLGALVQNRGWEISVDTKNITGKRFKWQTTGSITIARNKLLSFPGLSTSSYANTYVIGEPLSVKKLYSFLGVNPSTGWYEFYDADRNGVLNINDRIVLKNTQPQFYGGLRNTVTLDHFEIDLFIQYVKQPGLNYLSTLESFTPGYAYRNQPLVVLERWQRAGDMTGIQKFTTQRSGTVNGSNFLRSSNAVYSDASFLRGKTLSLSYGLPKKLADKLHFENFLLYASAQNLFTITNYKGGDPENQNIYHMPPLRTWALGLKANL